ncbi:MAG: GNAT family N-acetyltransferase [Alphaproteobacteria bacterium]|nr:GNAT family N-acetyltransferase [Alphaproteobacteria bacterium]
MSISLRQATSADEPVIASIFLASRRDALPYLPELHSDADTLDHFTNEVPARCSVWLAEEDAHGIGFMAWNAETAHLDHLYLLPGYYRRGIGTMLLEKAKALSKGKVQLYAFQRNARARAFYERHGFKAIWFGDGSENEENEPDVLYEWLR